MLFLPSHHYPQALTKGPNLPAPLNLCFKMKDMSNGGSFLILFLVNGMERKEGIGRGKKEALELHFPLLLHHIRFLPALSSLLEERGKFMEKFLEVIPPINCCTPPLLFGRDRESKRARVEKKQRTQGWSRGHKKRGLWRQLLERLVGDFQPLALGQDSLSTWSKQELGQARAPIRKGRGPSLISWRNCLQVGPSFPPIDRSARKKDNMKNAKKRW